MVCKGKLSELGVSRGKSSTFPRFPGDRKGGMSSQGSWEGPDGHQEKNNLVKTAEHRKSSQRNVESSRSVCSRDMDWEPALKVRFRDIVRNKKGKDIKANGHILPGFWQFITSKANPTTSRLSPGFALLQDRWESSNELKMEPHLQGSYTKKRATSAQGTL